MFDTDKDEHNRNIRLLLREHKKIPCNKFRQEYNNRFPNTPLPRCNTDTSKAKRKADIVAFLVDHKAPMAPSYEQLLAFWVEHR